MKTIFKTAGIVLAAGITLAACGSSSANSKTTGNKTGTTTGQSEVTLPHGNKPTAPIAALMKTDKTFAKQITNPKDWYYSHTFSRYVFVGPYTSGVNRRRVRDAKIAAMDSMELLTASSNYQTNWPFLLNGFNYDAFGQKAWAADALASLNKSGVELGHPALIAAVPSEATIVESPVGQLTAKQMANTASQPQNTTTGICVPGRFESVYVNRGRYAVPSTTFGVSPTDIYFADYGNTNVIVSSSHALTNGVGTNSTSSCAKFS